MLEGGLEKQTGTLVGKLAAFGSIPEDDDEVGDGRKSVLGGDARQEQLTMDQARQLNEKDTKEDEDRDILSEGSANSKEDEEEKPMGLADAKEIQSSASYKSRGKEVGSGHHSEAVNLESAKMGGSGTGGRKKESVASDFNTTEQDLEKVQTREGKSLSESEKGAKKELSDSGKGSQKELSGSGKGSKKGLSDSGKGAKKELSESGKESKKGLSDSGRGSKKGLSDSGKGSKKELSESGKESKKGLSDSGRGSKKGLSESESESKRKPQPPTEEPEKSIPPPEKASESDKAPAPEEPPQIERSHSSSSHNIPAPADKEPEEPEREEGLTVNDQVPVIPHIHVDDPIYSFELMDTVLARFIRTKGKSFPNIPVEMRRSLFQHISRRRAECIESQNYDEGEKLMLAQDMLRKAITKAMIASESEYSQISIATRLKEVKEMYQQKKEECDSKMKNLNRDLDDKEKEIKRQHKRELNEFSEFWMDPSSFHEFNKPSGFLLELRTKEKNLALLGDFTAAKDMKKRAEAQEKLETSRAQARAKQGMQVAYDQLVRKHQRELEAHQRLRHKVVGQAQVYADAELNPMIMAIKKLETMKEQKPMKRMSPRVSKSQLTARRERLTGQSYEDDQPPVSTPRTMKRLVDIRTTPRNEVLSLQGVPAKRYIKIQQQRERRKQREQERAEEEKKVKPTNF